MTSLRHDLFLHATDAGSRETNDSAEGYTFMAELGTRSLEVMSLTYRRFGYSMHLGLPLISGRCYRILCIVCVCNYLINYFIIFITTDVDTNEGMD